MSRINRDDGNSNTAFAFYNPHLVCTMDVAFEKEIRENLDYH